MSNLSDLFHSLSGSDWFFQLVICFFLLAGGVFCLGGSIGLLRFPDIYCKMQALSKPVTLGIFNLIIAYILFLLYAGQGLSMKGILAVIFLLLTIPIGSHMIIKASYRSGVPIWTESLMDQLADTLPDGGDNLAAQIRAEVQDEALYKDMMDAHGVYGSTDPFGYGASGYGPTGPLGCGSAGYGPNAPFGCGTEGYGPAGQGGPGAPEGFPGSNLGSGVWPDGMPGPGVGAWSGGMPGYGTGARPGGVPGSAGVKPAPEPPITATLTEKFAAEAQKEAAAEHILTDRADDVLDLYTRDWVSDPLSPLNPPFDPAAAKRFRVKKTAKKNLLARKRKTYKKSTFKGQRKGPR